MAKGPHDPLLRLLAKGLAGEVDEAVGQAIRDAAKDISKATGVPILDAAVVTYQLAAQHVIAMLQAMSPDHVQAFLDHASGRTRLEPEDAAAMQKAFQAQARLTAGPAKAGQR